MGQADKELNFGIPDQLLDGLARELKLSLTFIARQAEYQSEKDHTGLTDIEKSASDSLRLINNYLLCAQTEYGQQLLPMEPISPGSALYEVDQYFTSFAQNHVKDIVIQSDYNKPVMANKKALIAAVYSLAKIIINSPVGKGNKTLFLVSQKRRKGDLSIGVFAKGFKAKPSEIKRSAELLGKSNMSLSNQTFVSGVDLTIAGQLASSMGGSLFPAKYKGKGGIALGLIKSEQLSLVNK